MELDVAFLSLHLEVPSVLGDEAGMCLRENKEMYPVHYFFHIYYVWVCLDAGVPQHMYDLSNWRKLVLFLPLCRFQRLNSTAESWSSKLNTGYKPRKKECWVGKVSLLASCSRLPGTWNDTRLGHWQGAFWYAGGGVWNSVTDLTAKMSQLLLASLLPLPTEPSHNLRYQAFTFS